MNFDSIQKHYGILIVIITFFTRVVFIGFCWSYGTVIVEFKKQNSTLSDTELSWIGSVGQSFGGVLAPLILFLAHRFGYQMMFVISLGTCIMSLLISSTIRNLHWLLLTYSLPYGFANATIFILGTLVCGLYYPAGRHPRHVLVMCIISTGFPIGYHVMSALIFSSIKDNEWPSMKRRVAMLELLVTCVLGPFFTTKCLPNTIPDYSYSVSTTTTTVQTENNNRRIYFTKKIIYWMLGIFFTMCAVNNFLLHLHSQLEFLHLDPARADLWFRLHALFDALFRLSIPFLLRFSSIDIIYLFPTAAFTGIIMLTLTFGLLYTSMSALAILPIVLFGFTSAVVTSLQYTVSNRLFENDRTEQGYVYHVIITSLGTIVGPVIGGLFIDATGNYKTLFPTSIFFLFISFIFFGATILLSTNTKSNELEQNQISHQQHDNIAYGSAS